MSARRKKGSEPFFYEMSLSRADFMRLLPVAVGHEAWRLDGNQITGEGGRIAWRIVLQDMPGRRFGPVELPVLAVTLDVGKASPAEREAFVARFLLGFQRAGG